MELSLDEALLDSNLPISRLETELSLLWERLFALIRTRAFRLLRLEYLASFLRVVLMVSLSLSLMEDTALVVPLTFIAVVGLFCKQLWDRFRCLATCFR
jgi:hypothetical protein